MIMLMQCKKRAQKQKSLDISRVLVYKTSVFGGIMASGFKLPADEFAVRRKSFELLHSALPKRIE